MAQLQRIDLNTASREQLMWIRDIGDDCADLIIQEREKRGGFKSLQELDEIPGFGPNAMENLQREAFVSRAEEDKVNVNTASREELTKISNVGDECADRIINERERRGGFQDLSELDDIIGFGEAAISSLREEARV